MEQPTFRPLRNQTFEPQQESEQVEQTVESPQQPLFQRQQSGQIEQKKSVFPEWDLLPPRTVVRRKSL